MLKRNYKNENETALGKDGIYNNPQYELPYIRILINLN